MPVVPCFVARQHVCVFVFVHASAVVADLYAHLETEAPIAAELPTREPSRSLFDELNSPSLSSPSDALKMASHDDLISIAYTHSLVESSTNTLDVDFNILHIEFNPETILQLVEFSRALSKPKVCDDGETPLTSPVSRPSWSATNVPNTTDKQSNDKTSSLTHQSNPDTNSDPESDDSEDFKRSAADVEPYLELDYVQVRTRARLQRLSISLNKETESRKLVLVDMGASSLDYDVNKLGTYSASGALGRFHISDISGWKNRKLADADRALVSTISEHDYDVNDEKSLPVKMQRHVDYCRKLLGLRNLKDDSVLKFR